MKEFITNSDQETIQLAQKLVLKLPNEINTILLEGQLSAGKTTFTKGIGLALNVKRIINSPTFTILKSYDGNRPLHHFDFYRIDNDSSSLGFEEIINDDKNLCVIEWPYNLKGVLPNKYIVINIDIINDNQRRITVNGVNVNMDWLQKI